MVSRSKRLHAEWLRRLVEMPDWEPYLIFGFEQPRAIGILSSKSAKQNLGWSKRFEKGLIRLCRDFDFKIDSPDFFRIGNQLSTTLNTAGKIDAATATKLIEVLTSLRNRREQLTESQKYFSEHNKRKPGPAKMPPFLARFVLVGLHLHRESESGLKELRTSIEPNGDLENWLKKKSVSTEKVNWLSTTGPADIKSWAVSKRETLQKAIVSSEVGREVRVKSGFAGRFEHLRNQVEKLANEIVVYIDSQKPMPIRAERI